VLARLGQLEPTDEEFDRLVAELIVTARRHLDFEEARVWPALRQVLSHAEAQELGGTMERARQHRLLRPRPRRNYVARRPAALSS
jgi:hemerythrin-like domain-containing protein